jgi:hypothetical protein
MARKTFAIEDPVQPVAWSGQDHRVADAKVPTLTHRPRDFDVQAIQAGVDRLQRAAEPQGLAGVRVIDQVARHVLQSDGFAWLKHQLGTKRPRRLDQFRRCPERRLPAAIVRFDTIFKQPPILHQRGNRRQDGRVGVGARSVSLCTRIVDLAPAVRHALPGLGAEERLGEDHRAGGLIDGIAGGRQAEGCGQMRRQRPLIANRPISIPRSRRFRLAFSFRHLEILLSVQCRDEKRNVGMRIDNLGLPPDF